MTQAQIFVTCVAVLVIVYALFHAKTRGRRPQAPRRNTQVMVDIETLGTAPGCKVLAIGASVFTRHGVLEHKNFYRAIKRHTGQEMLAEDPDTVIWWSQQTDAARANLLTDRDGDDKDTLTHTLIMFNKWLVEVAGTDERGNTRVELWGNGSDFDNAILSAAYKAVGVKQGWPFWANRCYRTLKNLVPEVPMQRLGTHHNALDDAHSQALHASALFEELRLWGQ